MPEIIEKLMICWKFRGGVTYSDLTDRPESGELFEYCAAWVTAWTEAEKVAQARAEARANAGRV